VNEIEMVLNKIFERTRFKFPDLQRYLCFKTIAPLFKCCVNRVRISSKAVAQFRQGEKQLNKAFDITKIIKAAKVLDIVIQSMMTDEQMLLLQLQKKNVLEDHEVSSCISEPEPVDVFNDSTKVVEGLVIKNKVKKVVQKIMSNKMSALDWRLVYGIIEKDFKKHDVYANLPEDLESKVSSELMNRINLIKKQV
jgi:hypothetical protein